MKKSKQPVEKRFSIKDIIIIILSLLALVGLVFVMKMTKDEEQKKQEELGNISNEIQNSGTGTIVNNSSSTAGVMINEANQEGWIELYYTGKTSYLLDGLQVYVSGNKVYEVKEEWRLMAGDYAVLELGVPLGASNGEVLELRKKDGSSVEYLLLPSLEAGESYGATTDGNIDKAYLSATKGATNAEATVRSKNSLRFSVPGGFYENDFLLELMAPEGYTVYYTTDGTEPTLESTKYEAPFRIQNRSGGNYIYATGMQENFYTPSSIDMGTVVRAIMVDASGNVKEEKIASYFVGFIHDTDYENLPVLSIVTNPENLFDYHEGIYVTGRSYEDAVAMDSKEQAGNYYNGWTKNVFVEYFENNKDKSYESAGDLGIAWDLSMESSQKSFEITRTTELPQPGSTLTTYLNSAANCLQVRTYRMDNKYKQREYMAHFLLEDYTEAVLQMKPCIVFVDGEYWGLYMLQENFDKQYVKESYQTEDNRLAIVENEIAKELFEKEVYSDLYKRVVNNDLSIDENYRAVQQELDIQSYIDYVCINMYLANAEFGVSGKWWRSWEKSEAPYCDTKWRVTLSRLDNSMYNGSYGKKTTYSIDSFLMPSVLGDAFLQSLLMNEEFCKQLSDTMSHFVNEVFITERVDVALKQTEKLLKKASLSSYRRFFGNLTEEYYKEEIEKIRTFFELRGEYILKYTEEIVTAGGNMEAILAGREELEQLELLKQQELLEQQEAEQ